MEEQHEVTLSKTVRIFHPALSKGAFLYELIWEKKQIRKHDLSGQHKIERGRRFYEIEITDPRNVLVVARTFKTAEQKITTRVNSLIEILNK